MSISPEGHRITLVRATEMTAIYRENRLENYPICETFHKESVQWLLNVPNCAYFRIYYGMQVDKSVHAILVAVDKDGNDILPSHQYPNAPGGNGDGEILEDALRCPDNCPPPSPLTTQ
jgi:hypothetical protein